MIIYYSTTTLTFPLVPLVSALAVAVVAAIGAGFWFWLSVLGGPGGGTCTTTGLSDSESLFTSSTLMGPDWLFRWIW